MDEPKVTDKRKAPDKSSSGEMSDDDSLKQQAQVKRPRMEVPVTSEIDTIDAFVVPREGDVLSENLLETNNILGETAESVLKESPDAFLAVQEGVPTQILASDGDQQLDFKVIFDSVRNTFKLWINLIGEPTVCFISIKLLESGVRTSREFTRDLDGWLINYNRRNDCNFNRINLMFICYLLDTH